MTHPIDRGLVERGGLVHGLAGKGHCEAGADGLLDGFEANATQAGAEYPTDDCLRIVTFVLTMISSDFVKGSKSVLFVSCFASRL